MQKCSCQTCISTKNSNIDTHDRLQWYLVTREMPHSSFGITSYVFICFAVSHAQQAAITKATQKSSSKIWIYIKELEAFPQSRQITYFVVYAGSSAFDLVRAG